MNRMIGFGEACTSSITERRRFSNSPFMLAPACSRPMSSAQSCTSLSGGRHVAARDPQREALDHRRLAHAGLAGEDRVVLPPAHQDVDDLPDLLVAADDGIDLALARPAPSGRTAKRSKRLLLAHGRRRDGAARLAGRRRRRAVAGRQAVLRRARDDAREVVGERLDLDLVELARDARAARRAADRS